MDSETRKEVKGRTVTLFAYTRQKIRIAMVMRKLTRLYMQTHELKNGRRVKITKSRKIARGNAIINKVFDEPLDIKKDSINQLKIIDD